MGIVTAGNPSHMRRWIGCIVVAASALTGCAAHSGPRPMVAEVPSSQMAPSSEPATQSITETPATTQPQTAPTASGEITSPETHATTLPSRVETTNGGEMLPPRGQLIQVEGSPRGALDFSATATYLYGSVRGYTQVPAGGKLGTSYYERPHLQSLGITTANIADAEVSADAHQYGQFFVGAQIIQLSGSAITGGSPVTTDGISYQAHSRISSDVGLDWYRIGYRYTIPIDTAQNGVADITLTPYAEALIWDFNYNLTVPRKRTAHRAFAEGGVQIGATGAWRPNGGPLSLEATVGGFPQASHLANVSVESFDVRYNFYEFQRFSFSGLLGVTWEQQDFRDRQPLPNHISVDFGPMLTAGLQIQF